MNDNLLKILLIEDNLAEVELIQELLAETTDTQFELKTVNRLGEGLEYLRQDKFDTVLLDLTLPDSRGVETVEQIKAEATTVPIIVLTVLNDKNIALEAVRKGAQDYLVKGQLEGELLFRAINYAIERQQIEETLRQQAHRERLLGQIIERVRQSLEIKDILQATVEAVQQFLKTERVIIYRSQLQQRTVVVETVSLSSGCIWNPDLDGTLEISEEPLLNLLPAVEPAKIPDLNSPGSPEGSTITIPIIWDETIPQTNAASASTAPTRQQWGQLVVDNRAFRQWQHWETDFLQQLANQMAIAIQRSELYRRLEKANQELQQLATTDELTGVANRRQFEQVLTQEWQRLAREQTPLSLILCDIDCFKAYNDTYGHPAGDVCLQRVSQVINQAIQRSTDLVARYGGEEFVVILPSTNEQGALLVAQKIRAQLAALNLTHRSTFVPNCEQITLSIGTATRIPLLEHSAVTLVEAADTALYQAKAEGRDRIVQNL